MGAVGAIAPMVFESVGASTHGFWWILSQIHKFSWEKIWKLLVTHVVIPWQKIEVKPPQFQIDIEGPG